jgi:hypothetical protein
MKSPSENDPIAAIRKALLLSLFSLRLSRDRGEDEPEPDGTLAIELKVLKYGLRG